MRRFLISLAIMAVGPAHAQSTDGAPPLKESMERAERVLDAAVEVGVREYEKENERLIATEVRDACQELYEQDHLAAMTSQVCVDLYFEEGHPEMHSYGVFVGRYGPATFSLLGGPEIFDELTPSQVSDACGAKDSYRYLCRALNLE